MGNHRKDYSSYLLTYIGVIFIKSVEYIDGRAWFSVVCTACGRSYQSQPTHVLDKRRKNECCKVCCDKNTQDYSKKAHTPKDAQITISFSNYKSRAKSKNWEFSLTKEEFSGLSLSNCHYCNQEPPKS